MFYIALKIWTLTQLRFLRNHWKYFLRGSLRIPYKVAYFLKHESVMGTAKSLEGGDSISPWSRGKACCRYSNVSFQDKCHHYQRLCPLGLKILHGPVQVHTGVLSCRSWGLRTTDTLLVWKLTIVPMSKESPAFCWYLKMKQTSWR